MNVASDACILINFAIVNRLDLLGKIAGFHFHVTREVLDEIEDPEQRERVEQAIRCAALQLTALSNPDELDVFVRHNELLGKGESSCLALVQHRQWVLGTNDSKGTKWKKVISAPGIQVLNTAGIILLAIRKSILTVEQADEIKKILENNRFRLGFPSFKELI